MAYRWSGKRVRELLEEFSDNQKNFKTKPSGRLVRIHPKGYQYATHGYFYIDGAYGGWQLEYVLPYSTGVTNVSPGGHVPSGKLADFLLALGPGGLKMRFKELEKHYKPLEREHFNRRKAKYKEEHAKPGGKKGKR